MSSMNLDENSLKHLMNFLNNIEEKLSSMKNVYEKFSELITLISQTHGTIFQEIATIKNFLNQTKNFEQNLNILPNANLHFEDEHFSSSTNRFQSKSVTNLNSIDDQNSSVSSSSFLQESPQANSLINEVRPNSASTKRSSSLKKSANDSKNRVKSPKSVSFTLDQNKDLIPVIKEPIVNEINHEPTPAIVPRPSSDLLPDLFQQHHQEIITKPNIGYQMGNALTNVRIHEIDLTHGEYLRLLNISNSVDYDLTGHFLQQNVACVPVCRFRFPVNTIIRAGQTVTVWCGALKNIESQPPEVFVWKEHKQWDIGPECVTILAKPTGQAIAWTRSSHRLPVDQGSSEIFPFQSKIQIGSSDNSSITSSSLRSASRISTSNFIGQTRRLSSQSPLPNEHRSPVQSKSNIGQLLNRPKSSPFSSHAGCKQDLVCMNLLRTKTSRDDQQTTVKI